MLHFQLVEKDDISQHNEYYEVHTTQDAPHFKSLYFTTNEENLEEVAAAIAAEHMPNAKHWTIIPHRKNS